jgi:ubiquinone/menaquinone biosynthesis C-methylase UbiE
VGFYRERIFPRLCHLTLGSREVARLRQELLAPLAGEVLEVGFGTGLNLPHYPAAVSRLVGVEPNPGMFLLVDIPLGSAGRPFRLETTRAEALPFADASFDAAVSTFTLCSIAAVERALSELKRVLRPGGLFAFLEHGLAEEPRVARWQRRLTPIQRRLGDGCHLDRPIEALIAAAGFAVEQCRRSYLAGAPKVTGALYQGLARKV